MDKRVIMFGLAALLAASTAMPPVAHAQTTSPADIILLRQAAYAMNGGTFGGLKAAVDAKADVKPLAARADALAKWGHAMTLAFPAGSDIGHPTKALPTVWSDRAGFEKAAANFAEASEKLSVLAKAGDTDGFAAQWKVTGDTCGACHKEYRAK